MPEKADEFKYPLLQRLLALKELALMPTYTNRTVAQIFGVTTRTIQSWIASGKMKARDLPGRVTFLPVDLEDFLNRSHGNESTGVSKS